MGVKPTDEPTAPAAPITTTITVVTTLTSLIRFWSRIAYHGHQVTFPIADVDPDDLAEALEVARRANMPIQRTETELTAGSGEAIPLPVFILSMRATLRAMESGELD